MGGDYAPANAVLGAVEAYYENQNFDLFFVGKKKQIEEVLSANNLFFNSRFQKQPHFTVGAVLLSGVVFPRPVFKQ